MTAQKITLEQFRDESKELKAGPYEVTGAEGTQYVYLVPNGEVVRLDSKARLESFTRKRSGDHYTDAKDLVKGKTDKDGKVTIQHITGLGKPVTKGLTTTIDRSNPVHQIQVPARELMHRQNPINGAEYLVYADQHLKDVYNIVREDNGELVTGYPDKINWIN